MVYNVSFDICALVISTFSLFIIISRKGLQRESNRLLMYAIIMALISAVFDIWSSVANSYVYNYNYLYRDVLNYVFLFAHTSTASLFTWYMVSLLGLRPRFTPWLTTLFFLPQTLGVALPLILNPFFHWVFYYDTAHIYSHGNMIYVLYATGYFYMLLCVYLAVRFRHLLLKSQRNMAFLLLIFSIIPIVIQQFFMPHQLLELFFQSIGMFGFLTTVEDFDRIYDPITNTYNRTAFLHDIPLAKESNQPLSLLIVKFSRPRYWELASESASYASAFGAKVAEILNRVSKKVCSITVGVVILHCSALMIQISRRQLISVFPIPGFIVEATPPFLYSFFPSTYQQISPPQKKSCTSSTSLIWGRILLPRSLPLKKLHLPLLWRQKLLLHQMHLRLIFIICWMILLQALPY
jgi:hypothetical protein